MAVGVLVLTDGPRGDEGAVMYVGERGRGRCSGDPS